MSDVFEGDQWKYAEQPKSPSAAVAISLKTRTRAEQQAWLDDQYSAGRITRQQCRFQFDLVSTQKADGSFLPLE